MDEDELGYSLAKSDWWREYWSQDDHDSILAAAEAEEARAEQEAAEAREVSRFCLQYS
jgi:hypothetical protein